MAVRHGLQTALFSITDFELIHSAILQTFDCMPNHVKPVEGNVRRTHQSPLVEQNAEH